MMMIIIIIIIIIIKNNEVIITISGLLFLSAVSRDLVAVCLPWRNVVRSRSELLQTWCQQPCTGPWIVTKSVHSPQVHPILSNVITYLSVFRIMEKKCFVSGHEKNLLVIMKNAHLPRAQKLQLPFFGFKPSKKSPCFLEAR